MPFLGISYNVRPGHDDEIADIFSERNFTRVDTPVLRDETGAPAGRNLATALFIQGDTMARIVQFEGDVRYLSSHMGRQPGVREAERRLAPYLAVPRDTQTAEGFQQYFRNARMECLFQRESAPRPARLAALRYTIKPERTEVIRAVFAGLHPEGRLGYITRDPSPIVGEGAFVKGASMVRMLQFHGDLDAVVAYLARTGYGIQVERSLAPHLHEPASGALYAEYGEVFRARRMRVLQELSIDQPPVRT